MNVQRSRRRPAEQGFNLIEVILALGILAGVLISISSMFVLGGRQVKGGKTMTEATIIAHDLMEEFDSASFTGLYLGLGAAGTDTTKTVLSTTSGSPIEPWQAEIDGKLENGVATVNILPVGAGTPDFGTADGIKLTVTVSWNELGRAQSVSVSTVRF